MRDLLLGIDVGTYSSKAVLTEADGTVLRVETLAHDIMTPHPGHVEQDADAVWWADVTTLCKKMLANGPFTADDIAGVAVSAIGPCLLPLCKQGKPLRPAILYGVDTRATTEIDELTAELGAKALLEHAQMTLTSQSVGPKIRWLQKHEPEVWSQTRQLTSASAYLVFKLTGEHILDHHTASHFVPIYDPSSRQWSEQFARHMNLPISMLPRLGWSHDAAGQITGAASKATGLRAGTPVAIGTVDALSEAISVGVCEPGDLMIMYGSTTFFILVQEVPTPDPRVWTTAGAHPDQFNLAAGMGTTGSLTRWFVNEFSQAESVPVAYKRLFAAASGVPAGSGGILMLPYFNGERTPINDPRAKGVIAGLSLHHKREHLFKAMLEGVALGVRQNLETFAAIGAVVKRVVAVGGGAQSDLWPQIISDVCGIRQNLTRVKLGACFGDAFMAGCAAGLISRADIQHWVVSDHALAPDLRHRAIYDHLYPEFLNLYQSTREIVHKL